MLVISTWDHNFYSLSRFIITPSLFGRYTNEKLKAFEKSKRRKSDTIKYFRKFSLLCYWPLNLEPALIWFQWNILWAGRNSKECILYSYVSQKNVSVTIAYSRLILLYRFWILLTPYVTLLNLSLSERIDIQKLT